jgi:hypothetical protein
VVLICGGPQNIVFVNKPQPLQEFEVDIEDNLPEIQDSNSVMCREIFTESAWLTQKTQ